MAVALPLLASGLSVSAGISAGVATLTGFLQVAGGALTALGALTGKKDLLKVGAVMSLGGAGLNALGSAGAETAAAAGGEGLGIASAGMEGAAEAASGAAVEGLSGVGEVAAPEMGLSTQATGGAGLGIGDAMPSGGMGRPSLMQTAMQREPSLQMPQQPVDPLQEVGSRYTSESLQKTLDAGNNRIKQMFGKLGDTVDNVGSHLQKNRYLYQLGGGVLNSMYGPEAERADWEKSLMARRLRNLNSPIPLGPMSRGA